MEKTIVAVAVDAAMLSVTWGLVNWTPRWHVMASEQQETREERKAVGDKGAEFYLLPVGQPTFMS